MDGDTLYGTLWIRKVPQAAELWDLIQMQGRLFGLMAGGKEET